MNGQQELTACIDQSCTHPQGKHTIYRLVVRYLLKGEKVERIVYKRFSDFLCLHRDLRRVHSALGCTDVFPTLSKSHRMNRFEPTVVEERRVALDNFVKYIASNPCLYCHTHFTRFVVAGFSSRVTCDTETQGSMDVEISGSSSPLSSVNSLNSLPLVSTPIDWPPQFQMAESNTCLNRSSKSSIFGHLESPVSSDSDEEVDGGFLVLIWEASTHRESKIVSSMQSAKDFILERRWVDAYRCYKGVISQLLRELNSSKLEPSRREDYQCLMSACLAKTEFIHREFLAHPSGTEETVEEGSSSIHSWTKRRSLSSLCKDAALSPLFGSVEELKNLKICAIEGLDLVVCSRNDESVVYTLKCRSLPNLPETRCTSIPLISSAKIDPCLAQCRHILPVGEVSFMRRLLRVVETRGHSRVFLLVERTKGELRLVDWLGAYLESRISSLIGGKCSEKLSRDEEARRHLKWCEARSSRIRSLVGKKWRTGGGHFGEPETCCYSVPKPLLIPSAIFVKYPPQLSCESRHRSQSLIGCSKSIAADSSEVEVSGESGKSVRLLPERQCLLWAAEIVSVVAWLHSRHISLGNLNRSSIFLTQSGNIEVDYFFRWESGDEVSVESADSAPELVIGPQARTFLSSSACDWWSVGVVLFEIFTGLQLHEAHRDGLWSGEQLQVPPTLSREVVDLLNRVKEAIWKLLKINPKDRISDSDVKDHAAFKSIDWSRLGEVKTNKS